MVISLKSLNFFKTFRTFGFCSLILRQSIAMSVLHVKCRAGMYPRSTIARFNVPDDYVSWQTEFKEYNPSNYTSQAIYGKPWADPAIGDTDFVPKWNSIDGPVNRVSYTGEYEIVNGFPQNPYGRTGICGRGVLGRWGPNHAADPVVTRWKTSDSGQLQLDPDSKKLILQVVVIKRRDSGEWALPGGMVDPGEKVCATAVREFKEEAINSLFMSNDGQKAWEAEFQSFFSGGDVVYEGYVDDPRNTDNAWMETAAYSFHDDDGTVVGALKLHAGDDAVGVLWVDVTPGLKLYASHNDILNEAKRRVYSKSSKCKTQENTNCV